VVSYTSNIVCAVTKAWSRRWYFD